METRNRFLKTFFVFLVVLCFALTAFAVTAGASDDGLPFDAELYYGRSQLAKMENGESLVAAYDKITKGIEKGTKEKITLVPAVEDINVSIEEMRIILAAHRFDNPQQFWLKQYTSMGLTEDRSRVISLYVEYDAALNTDEAKAAFKSAADKLISDCGVTSDMSDYDIALKLHDAVVEHITYVDTANAHNSYGALVEGYAVCEGYAELYQYLLYRMGISSHIITGVAGEAHAWNLVLLDGEYYMSDPTWDDPIGNSTGRIFHGYFNVTKQKLIDEGRTIENHGYPIPECTATKANYFNYYFYDLCNFKDQPSLKNALSQLGFFGEARFHYCGEGEYTFDDFKNWCRENQQNFMSNLTFLPGTTTVTFSFIPLKDEYILGISSVKTTPLPVVQNIPKIASVCFDSSITVRPGTAAGNVAVCPIISGAKLYPADILGHLNNTAVEISGLKDGTVVTGSRFAYNGEEAVIAVKGDVDGDGQVSVFDAMFIKKAQKSANASDKFEGGKELNQIAGDVDGNGETGSTDAKAMLQHITGNNLLK